MKRDLDALSSRHFDVLVIGGGVHGACVARDAALRGLSVALIEQADFSSATSHNSLKTIHGGIRYLQHLNVKRALESIREQDVFLNTAPHLVQPLRFLMPCYGWRMRGPVITVAGVVLFEMLGFFARLFGGRRARRPAGSVMSASRALALAPGLDQHQLTGAATWQDAQVSLADKAVLQMLQQAAEHKAVVANYVRANELVFAPAEHRVIGAHCIDTLTDQAFSVNAKVVINAAGPWVNAWVAGDTASAAGEDIAGSLRVGLVKSMNLLVKRPAPALAIGAKSRLTSDSKVDKAKRLYFAVPWQGQTIIGTTHFTHHEDSRQLRSELTEIEAFVDEFNTAYPSMNLSTDDVLYCYQGLTPGDDAVDADGAKLHHSKVVDHQQENKLTGLISIIGIKWTTARLVAEQAVDVACRHLGVVQGCKTRSMPIPDYASTAHSTINLTDTQLHDFVLLHIDHTQASGLTDIVLRRTNDLLLGSMSVQRVRLVFNTLATHYTWSEAEQHKQLATLMESGLGPQTRNELALEFKEFYA